MPLHEPTGIMPEILRPTDSRFGDYQKITEALEKDPAIVVGTIEELYQNIAEHTNQVDIVDLRHRHANKILGVNIQHGADTIRCIFKPESGERPKEKEEYVIESLAKRETAAALVDRHFGFDLTPPTVYREINGERGALQLFLDPLYYDTLRNLGEFRGLTKDQVLRYMHSPDFFTMACFDALCFNTERKNDNFLAQITDPRKLIAIDHGYCFSNTMWHKTAPRGPLMALTFEERRNRNGTNTIIYLPPTNIPRRLLKQLNDGMKKREALADLLTPYLPKEDIVNLFDMGDRLLKVKKYISLPQTP